jgi:hypothetical protein
MISLNKDNFYQISTICSGKCCVHTVIKNLYKLIHSSTLNKLKEYQTYLYSLCPITMDTYGTLKSPDAINYLNVFSKTSKVMCFQL